MINETSNEDLELKTIFSFLEAAPAKLFKSSTPFWQQKAWSRKAKITGEEYNYLSIYGEQLTFWASCSMLLFAYKYFNFKKQTLGIRHRLRAFDLNRLSKYIAINFGDFALPFSR